jgi:hypothetical protein
MIVKEIVVELLLAAHILYYIQYRLERIKSGE